MKRINVTPLVCIVATCVPIFLFSAAEAPTRLTRPITNLPQAVNAQSLPDVKRFLENGDHWDGVSVWILLNKCKDVNFLKACVTQWPELLWAHNEDGELVNNFLSAERTHLPWRVAWLDDEDAGEPLDNPTHERLLTKLCKKDENLLPDLFEAAVAQKSVFGVSWIFRFLENNIEELGEKVERALYRGEARFFFKLLSYAKNKGDKEKVKFLRERLGYSGVDKAAFINQLSASWRVHQAVVSSARAARATSGSGGGAGEGAGAGSERRVRVRVRGRATPAKERKKRDTPHLDKIRGHEEVKARIAAMAQAIVDGEEDASRTALLVGPPGTGKTLTAHAVAQDYGFTLLEWKQGGDDDRYVGAYESRIQDFFKDALEKSKKGPVLLFFDEIDAYCPIERKSDASVINGATTVFQVKIEELRSSGKPVFIIAATNRESLIKDAVRRRFGDALLFNPPGVDERAHLVIDHFAKKKNAFAVSDDTLFEFCHKTQGWTGRDFEVFFNNLWVSIGEGFVATDEDLFDAYNVYAKALTASFQTEDFTLKTASLASLKGRENVWSGVEGLPHELKARLMFLAEQMKKEKSLPGVRLLFHGESGCGKTLSAQIFAEAAGCTCITINAGALAVKDSAAETIRRVFAEAEKRAPTVVFIDEIDSLVNKYKRDFFGVRTCLQNIINTYEADDKGVVIIGASNHREEIHDAIKTRFDEIHFPPLRAGQRQKIFSVHLKKCSNLNIRDQEELARRVGRKTRGFSGRDLQRIITTARETAQRNRQTHITEDMIMDALAAIKSKVESRNNSSMK